MSGLPRDVRWLAEALLETAAAEQILGDLEEIGLERFPDRGIAWAAWVRMELLRSVAAVLRARVEGAARPSGGAAWRGLVLDGRAALRSFGRRPDLLATVLLSVALGIGGATSAFALYDAVLLRPLPYQDPGRLVRVLSRAGDDASSLAVSAPLVEAVDALPLLEATAVGRVRMVVPGESGAERLRGEAVGARYLELLGVAPSLGRLPTPGAWAPSAGGEIVVSHGLWVRRFGGDPDIVGRPLRSTAATYEVVGVMPPSYVGSTEEDVIDFWVPLPAWVAGESGADRGLLEDPSRRWLRSVARLAPTADLDQAREALRGRLEELRTLDPEIRPGLEPLGERWRRAARPGLLLLVGGSLCMLALACVNVAAMVLTRLMERRAELATRRALGATSGHLLRSLLLESLALAAAGAALGILAARAALGVVSDLILSELGDHVTLPAQIAPMLDGRALAVAAGLAAATGAATAVLAHVGLPGRETFAPGTVVRGGRGGAGGRSGRALAASQVALATVLVVGAALLLRSYGALRTVDPGFRTESLLKVQVTAADAGYPDGDARRALVERALDAVRAEPGVVDAAAVAPSMPPLTLWTVAIGDPAASDRPLEVSYHAVSDDFFDVLDVPLVAGRPLREASSPDGGVAAVSRSLAERLAGDVTRAVGRSLVLDPGRDDEERVTVVAVVEDVLYSGPTAPGPRLDLYLPLEARPSTFFGVAARVAGGAPLAAAPGLRQRLGALDPTLAVHWVESMEGSLGTQRSGIARRATVLALLSLTALAVAAFGLYGVLAYAAGRRAPEYALRMALGASGRDVALRVTLDGLLTVGLGLAAGIPGGLLFGRALRGLLHGVGPMDPTAAAAAVAVLSLTGLAAAAAPALRARRTSPSELLRGG